MAQGPIQTGDLLKLRFSDLPGWPADRHADALVAFLRFCDAGARIGRSSGPFKVTQSSRNTLCEAARAATAGDARGFFESHFDPYQIRSGGFVTGYFEPEVSASRIKTAEYTVPLHRKPEGLVAVSAETRPAGWPANLSHGRQIGDKLVELPDRAAIMEGALDGEELELVWLRDPVDAYYIHVQGSARLRLAEGGTLRIGYAGKTGHPYIGIARLLVERGEGAPEDFTMSGLRRWLSDNADKRDDLFKQNRSYIFFREVTETAPEEGPIGAAGLPLVPGRSLAIDDSVLPYGVPVFVQAAFADPEQRSRDFARLMISDDTGSAIKGPARGDIFVGSGTEAGRIAGEIRHAAGFTVLLPKPEKDRGN